MLIACRECEYFGQSAIGSCPTCKSTRIVSHASLSDLTIAHIDCDAFFAAIEKRDDSSLKDKPVLVGGGKRGVVSTCCYIARLHGIHSAMPMFKAIKACPSAVIVKPRYDAYATASEEIKEKLLALSPLVQMISIDEGFVDLSGTQAIHGAPAVISLIRLAREIEQAVGITISVGLADNKFLAKMASELDKPRGFAAISSRDASAFLAPLPVKKLHGVGVKLSERLKREDLHTVGDIQRLDRRELIGMFGETGLWLFQRSRGIDNRPITPQSQRKSVSSERTFEYDLGDIQALEDRLWDVCQETADRAKKNGVQGATVTLKLKTHRFKSITRSVTLEASTQIAQTIFRAMQPILNKAHKQDQKYRLIGVGLTQLTDATEDMPDLIDPSIEKRTKAERASDIARTKFGKEALQTGRALRLKSSRKT